MTKLKGKISFFTSGWLNVNMPCVLEVDGAIGTSPLNETDPTVSDWAKNPNPPTAEDIGALPAATNYAGSQSVGGAADKAVSIPYGETDSSSTATAYTATIDGITELRDGVCCILRNTARTSTAGFTLNINNLGAKPLYSANKQNSQEGYTFFVNNTYLLVYNTTLGGWIMGKLSDENNDENACYLFNYTGIKAKTLTGRYMFCVTYNEEYVLPVNSYDNDTTTSKVLTTESFDIFGQVYYNNTSYSSAADSRIGGLFYARPVANMQLAFNLSSDLTLWKKVYLVCVPQSDGRVKLHSNPLSQSLPTTEDGLVYKLLGHAVSVNQICLYAYKPVYYFKDGQIREWTNNPLKTINNQSLLGSGNININENTAFEVRGTSFTPKAKDNVYRYSMVFQYSENLMVGSATSYSNTDDKELTTSDFDPFGVIYYNTSIATDGTDINGSNLYIQGYYDFRYAFKIIADPLVAGKAVYLKCLPLVDSSNNRTGRVRFAGGQPIVQTLPITADGYVYIFLGWACSTTSLFLCHNHPIYEFKDGAIRLWTNSREDILKSLKQDKIPIVSVASNASSLSCEEDKYYRLDTAVNTFSITLPTVTDVGIAKSVIIYLTTGTTPAVTITSTQQLHYSYGFSLEASKTYEINALWNGAAWTITSIEF